MAFYKRCSAAGVCDKPNPDPSVKAGGNPKVPGDMVYQCLSNATTPCTGSCRCFVVVTHHKPGSADDEEVGQEHFPGGPNNAQKDPYKGMLTQADVTKNYKQIGRTKGGPARQEYWDIVCRCLEIDSDGDPLAALNLTLTVPGRAYAATLRELQEKYGKKNVVLAERAADSAPASKR